MTSPPREPTFLWAAFAGTLGVACGEEPEARHGLHPLFRAGEGTREGKFQDARERKGKGKQPSKQEKKKQIGSEREEGTEKSRGKRGKGGCRWRTLPFSGRRGHLTRRDCLTRGWGGMPRQNPPSRPGSRVLGAPFRQLRGRSPRSRGYSGVAAAPPAAPGSVGGEGKKVWGRSGCEGGAGAVRLSPPYTLPRGLLTWGLRGSFPASAAPACPSVARLPPQSEPAEKPALLSKRRGLAAAAGREGATAGCCRVASGGREPSARSRHLEPRQQAGVQEQGKGPGGSTRGARSAGV